MNILLLGSGGRESALAWKMKQSKKCGALFIAPGNGGTPQFGENINLNPLDFEKIKDFSENNQIDLIVCGPELPAVNGIWDYFQSHPTIKVVAPSKIAANLEGSKFFAKQFMEKHQIPTASYIQVDAHNIEIGFEWFEKNQPPFVIKADGLAEGKGVVISDSKEDAKATLESFILNQKFGASSQNVVLEEFLEGIEFSIFVYTNGNEYVMLPNAKDYKRRFEGNIGLNTGGMGCISPVPFVDKALLEKVKNQIIEPTIKGLQKDKMPYFGFIYFGLILTKEGPKVIEYNCRLGDPETQVILPRIHSDIIELFERGFENTLSQYQVEISEDFATTVILASDGYPENYVKGFEIKGMENVNESIVFHAGTKLENNLVFTNGGRVMAITSMANSLNEALEKSYQSINQIHYKGKVFRNDIGFEFL